MILEVGKIYKTLSYWLLVEITIGKIYKRRQSKRLPKIKVGKIYKTRNSKLLVKITIREPKNQLYLFKGIVLNLSLGKRNGVTYYKGGRYYPRSRHPFDLVEEVTDPVILAFYQK